MEKVMSAAPHDAPEVHIPARARRRQGSIGARRGTLVAVAPVPVVPAGLAAAGVEMATADVAGRAASRPATVVRPRACPTPRPSIHRDRAPRALRAALPLEAADTGVGATVAALLLAPAPALRPVEMPSPPPIVAEPVRTTVVQTVVVPVPQVLIDGAAILPNGPGNFTPIQLTRRGHWLIAVTTAVLGVALVGGAYAGATGTVRPSEPVPARVVVHSGDTLWSIAARIAPNRDPRDEVADLRRINNIGANLTPGQVVRTR
jgi:nucleoid-associated protein YgaU